MTGERLNTLPRSNKRTAASQFPAHPTRPARAADIVLLASGLSVIIDAIKEADASFSG